MNNIHCLINQSKHLVTVFNKIWVYPKYSLINSKHLLYIFCVSTHNTNVLYNEWSLWSLQVWGALKSLTSIFLQNDSISYLICGGRYSTLFFNWKRNYNLIHRALLHNIADASDALVKLLRNNIIDKIYLTYRDVS